MLANLKPAKFCEIEPKGMMLVVGNCKKIAVVPKPDSLMIVLFQHHFKIRSPDRVFFPGSKLF